jgi:hypothetical protein
MPQSIETSHLCFNILVACSVITDLMCSMRMYNSLLVAFVFVCWAIHATMFCHLGNMFAHVWERSAYSCLRLGSSNHIERKFCRNVCYTLTCHNV